MKLELNVKDRLVIISILPTNGTMVDMVEIINLVKTIKFDEDEKNALNYTEEDGKIYWDVTKEEFKEFDITFEQVAILKKAIKQLDTDGKIDLNCLDTCLKINSI